MNGRTVLAKDTLAAVALLGVVAIAIRLVFGLGASTAMSEAVPWGLWKIMNMVAGVALAPLGQPSALIGVTKSGLMLRYLSSLAGRRIRNSRRSLKSRKRVAKRNPNK